jgi:DNA-binding NtrC family response regulator
MVLLPTDRLRMTRHRSAILIAAADYRLRQRLGELLLQHGYEVPETCTPARAPHAIRQRPDLLLAILEAPIEQPAQAFHAAAEIRRFNKRIPLVLIASRGSEEIAAAALRSGFCDYFNQAFSQDALLASLERSLGGPAHPPAVAESTLLPSLVGGERMIGESKSIQEIKSCIGKVAASDSNVLITGETGTGKELTAQLIHENSVRRGRPLVCVNCAAIPDSLLESELFGYERGAFTGAHASNEGMLARANGGTVFLDEIGDLTLYAQAKILRAIETKEVQRLGGRRSVQLNVRIIAGTNQKLDSMVSENKFREDLYYRLNVVRIHLQPLRQRRSDLRPLFDQCIRELNGRFGRRVKGLTESALNQLLEYDWPGNVRELRNLFEAIYVTLPREAARFIDIPESFRERLGNGNGARRVERERLLAALLATNWNKSKAAQQLHWSRMTLYRKLSKYNLDPTGSDATTPLRTSPGQSVRR